ncbi:MAG: hypothetical protein ACI35S_08235 [Anaeroplasma sp.]
MDKDGIKNTIIKSEDEIKEFIKDYNLNNEDSTITIDLSNCEIYQPYSNKTLLDSNIYDYINQIYRVLNEKKLSKRITIKYPQNMDTNEQEKIKRLLKIHYASMFRENTIEIRRTNKKGLILLLIGAIFLVFYSIMQYNDFNFIYCSIIEIFSWVFVWESCNCFFLVNTSNRVERIKNLNIYNALSKDSL